MRVGYVLKRYPRYSETFVVNEILAHEAAGLPIEVFALRPPADSHFQDAISRVRAPVSYLPYVPVKAAELWLQGHRLARRFPVTFTALAEAGAEDVHEVYQALVLAEHAADRGITHLHAHFATSAATVARLAARLSGLPWSFTAHAKDIFHESVTDQDLGGKLAAAAATITVSDYNLEYLRGRFGERAARVTRVYNGLELTRFPYNAPGQRPPRVVAVGRLVEKKGFAVLVDACEHLAAKGIDFTCSIIGTGELERPLAEQIRRLDLGERVQLVGPRPQAEIAELVRGAAVLAAPCVVGADGNRDGLPTVILEAMALGTPCVTTPVTGIPEVARHEETALVVAERDPVALATALGRLLAQGDLRVRLAERARDLIVREFDATRNAGLLRRAIRVG